MIKSFKCFAVLGVGAIMLVAAFLPIFKANAIENPEEYARILMRQATDFANDGLSYNFLYENGSVTVTGFTEHTTVENINWNYGDHEGTMLVIYTKDSALNFEAVPIEGHVAELWIGGQSEELADGNYTLSNMTTNEEYELEFVFRDEEGEGPVEGNTEATVTLGAMTPAGSYERNIYNENNEIVDTETFHFSDTYIEASFAINGGRFFRFEPEDEVENEDYSQVEHYRYNTEEGDETVDITITTLWNWRLVDEYVNINSTNYPITINYEDQKSYLDHYGGQMVGFTITGVPIADVYDIRLDAMQEPHEAHTWIGNFLWTSDPEQQWERDCHFDEEADKDVCEYILDENGDKIPGHDYIGNASLNLVEVIYTVGNDADGYTTYTCNADTMSCSQWASDADGNALPDVGEMGCNLEEEECMIPYLEFDSRSGQEELTFDDGSLVVPSGATVTMEVIPDYGYQILNVQNMNLEVSENGVGRFTFTIPEGAAYFMADVVPMEDTVNTSTDLVTDGTINLGEDQTTLDHGTAMLKVGDVELDANSIEGFEQAADGYNIKNYLEISLFNITCKGAVACVGTEEDSWIDQISDLNEPATITLQLEDGVDGNEIVIVHEKHDGTHEIIPTEYDPETHTLTFTTTSFSNYAIASRTVAAPETGDITNDGASAAVAGSISIAIAFVAIMCYNCYYVFRKKQN